MGRSDHAYTSIKEPLQQLLTLDLDLLLCFAVKYSFREHKKSGNVCILKYQAYLKIPELYSISEPTSRNDYML